MPCISDYMEPNAEEQYSKETATLLIFTHKKLYGAEGATPVSWILEAANNPYGSPTRKDDLTRLLCGMLRDMTEENKEKIIWNGRDPMSRKLAEWWEKHQAVDAKREQRSSKGKDLWNRFSVEDKEALKSFLIDNPTILNGN